MSFALTLSHNSSPDTDVIVTPVHALVIGHEIVRATRATGTENGRAPHFVACCPGDQRTSPSDLLNSPCAVHARPRKRRLGDESRSGWCPRNSPVASEMTKPASTPCLRRRALPVSSVPYNGSFQASAAR
jgi:hypothetical protein